MICDCIKAWKYHNIFAVIYETCYNQLFYSEMRIPCLRYVYVLVCMISPTANLPNSIWRPRVASW